LLHCNVFLRARIDGPGGRAYAPPPSSLEKTMRRLASLLLALIAVSLPVRAQEAPGLAAQIPLLPLAEGVQRDIDDLAVALWGAYYHTGAEHAFARADLRAGRFDLNGDGQAELVLMVVAPGWEADQGHSYVVARWADRRWMPVGWGWSAEDSLFATTEVKDGWRTLMSNSQILRWNGREYQITERDE